MFRWSHVTSFSAGQGPTMLRNAIHQTIRRKFYNSFLPSISNLNSNEINPSLRSKYHFVNSNIQTIKTIRALSNTTNIPDDTDTNPKPRPRTPTQRKKRYSTINDDEITARLPVKSIYAARTIDIDAIVPKLVYKIKNSDDTSITSTKVSSLFHNNTNVSSSPVLPSPTTYRHMGKNCVILQYPPEENEIERFAIVFRFGSVVFINMQPLHADVILKEIKSFR